MSRRKSQRRLKRVPKGRPQRTPKLRVLVVVEGDEGKAEQQYFESLGQFVRPDEVSPYIKVVPGKGEPSRVLQTCEDNLKKYSFDCAYLVVDVDEHARLADVLSAAPNKGIDVVVTRPKFEQWLLWHIVDRGGSGKEADVFLQKKGYMRGKSLHSSFPVCDFKKAMDIAYRYWSELEPNKIGPLPSSSIPYMIQKIYSV